MSDRPCHSCTEFTYKDTDNQGRKLCQAINQGLAIRLDLPNDPHNPDVGIDQIGCVAQRLKLGANGEPILFRNALKRATALTDFASVVDAIRIAESHDGKL